MTSVPPRASSVWAVMPAATEVRRRERQRIQEEARQQCQQRRERVLAHEWACKRLCQIFSYKQATQWNGYVPPKWDPLPDRLSEPRKLNTSPHRKALVQLLHDVDEFDRTGRMPGETLDAVQVAIPAAAE